MSKFLNTHLNWRPLSCCICYKLITYGQEYYEQAGYRLLSSEVAHKECVEQLEESARNQKTKD